MGRFVLGVLVAALAWWGYQNFWVDEASADGSATEISFDDLDDPLAEDEADGVEFDVEELPDRAEPKKASLSDWFDRFGAGDTTAAARAFPWLLRLEGRPRERIAAAIAERADAAEGYEELLALIGPTNAYLHCPEGRELANSILELLPDVSKKQAVGVTNRLLERAMTGKIPKGAARAKLAVDEIYAKHQSLVRQVVFDPANAARTRTWKIQAGESLTSIASKFRKSGGIPLEAGTLAVLNRISNPDTVQVGQVLRIPIDPIRTEVSLRAFLMAVYCGDYIVRLYWCAHGKDGHDTPETTFVVGDKDERPDWTFEGRVIPYGSPENPLGSHFVKFKHESYSGFGAHGTSEPDSIGTRASLGCIRLGADDIIDFVNFVPRGAKVTIR